MSNERAVRAKYIELVISSQLFVVFEDATNHTQRTRLKLLA